MSHLLKEMCVCHNQELPVHPSNIIHTEQENSDFLRVWYCENDNNE